MRKLGIITLILVFVISTTPVYAQKKETNRSIKSSRTEVLSVDEVGKEFEKLSKKQNKKILKIDKFLQKKGFKPLRGKKNFWGAEHEYTDTEGKVVSYKFILQDYAKPNSKDGAARCQLEVTEKGTIQKYTFTLIAPEGDIEKIQEYMVDEKLEVRKANSWWSCVKDKLITKCSLVGSAALIKCAFAATATGPFSWATFIGCVSLAYGACFAVYNLCCACNCTRTCRWISGCCHM